MTDDKALPQPEETTALGAGSSPVSLKSGDDLAKAALAAVNQANNVDEVAASDEVAQTLNALQNLIERNANELLRISEELKHKRESLKNIFENDTTLAEAEQQVQLYANELKERKAKLQADPQVTQLKVMIGELNEEKKEVEEALSGELVSYYQLTNSTSFDTSDGDQWEFNIRAKVKPKKKAA